MSKPLVVFPQTSTLVPMIPLSIPTTLVDESALISAYTPEQKAVSVAQDIDIDRVVMARPSKSNKGIKQPYSLAKLKEFAKDMGIPISQTKARLVEAIRKKLTTSV